MARKSFTQAVREDPIEFDVPARDGTTIVFRCVDDIPGGVLFSFSGDEDNNKLSGAAHDLFNQAIVEEQRELFWQMANNAPGAPGVIGLSMMMAIAEWLPGEYAARPTGGSSDDGSPKTFNGSPSTVGASATASTYSRPEPTALTT